MGITTRQFGDFVQAVLRSLPNDLDPITVQGWIENQESLRKILREAFALNNKLAKPTGLPIKASAQIDNTYHLSVDYGRSVKEGVKAGRYNSADSDINSNNFQTNRNGIANIEVKLVHFNQRINITEVLREFERMGYRPADLHELLAFGEKYQEAQRDFPILALGSIWRDNINYFHVPCIYGDGWGRFLGTCWVGCNWDEPNRFAAVRK